ncbi:MAG: hypothetical protein R3A80_11345 [Bdellovibrionota bacterium]
MMDSLKKKMFFHGNFESAADWAFLSEEWSIFPLWDFLKKENFNSWDEVILALKELLMKADVSEVAGYSLGGRLLLGLIDKGFKVKSYEFFSTHPGLTSEDSKNARIWSDLKWKEKVLNSDWTELHREWNSQEIFVNSFKPYDTFKGLEQYRSEIAQAFDVLSLGRMPDFQAIKFPKDAKVQWVCGQHDHKFRALGESFCKQHPKINYLLAFNQSHRMPLFIKDVL